LNIRRPSYAANNDLAILLNSKRSMEVLVVTRLRADVKSDLCHSVPTERGVEPAAERPSVAT
jgi:hypothetical protein